MLKRCLILVLFLSLLGLSLGPKLLLADSGDAEFLLPHPIPLYPGSVQTTPTDITSRLTKDRFDTVKKFFEAKKIAGDRFEQDETEGQTGLRLVYAKAFKSKELKVQEVAFYAKKPDTNMHPALGELQNHVSMGKRSDSEYQLLYRKYKDLHLAYFRQVEDDQGRSASEGEVIYRKTMNIAHPKLKKGSDEERAAGKAKAQELKKQMQALKAKGDIEGMMKLAQQADTSTGQSTEAASAVAAMNQDTWDLWVKCLEDMNKVAYWTRFEYNGNALVK